jgi:3-phosphoshikimate 1-carboxyvinyltransferase
VSGGPHGTFAVEPLAAPPDATVRLPGSKSITNRALVTAALAHGDSVLTGALVADDTEAMVSVLRSLGVRVAVADDRVTVTGCAGRPPAAEADLDCRLSGTTSRFVLPVAALGRGRYRVDGAPPLRRRPMGPTIEALRTLGAAVVEEGEPGHLPVRVEAAGLGGGDLVVAGDASSQFLSGLLLAAPAMHDGLRVVLGTDLVSQPYVAMTAAVMAAFGGVVRSAPSRYEAEPGLYRGRTFAVEPDASAASYFFAAAAVTGGRVRVEGLGSGSLQGDLGFVDLLGRMGADVEVGDDAVEVRGPGRLRGIDADLRDLSDTAQTLAAVAVFAEGPTRITGVGFIRGKETDRIGAMVTELRRCGIDASEEDDGLVVHPGTPRPATVKTYDDHRMAMSFAVVGLRAPGIRIADPACVAKTFPGFWEALDQLRVGRVPGP